MGVFVNFILYLGTCNFFSCNFGLASYLFVFLCQLSIFAESYALDIKQKGYIICSILTFVLGITVFCLIRGVTFSIYSNVWLILFWDMHSFHKYHVNGSAHGENRIIII